MLNSFEQNLLDQIFKEKGKSLFEFFANVLLTNYCVVNSCCKLFATMRAINYFFEWQTIIHYKFIWHVTIVQTYRKFIY